MIFFCCFFIAVHDDPIRTDLWLLLGQEQPVKNHSLFIFSILHSFLSDRMYMASSEKVRPQQHGNQNNRSCPSTSPNAAVELSSLQPWHTTLHQLHDQDRQEWKAGWAFFLEGFRPLYTSASFIRCFDISSLLQSSRVMHKWPSIFVCKEPFYFSVIGFR